MTGTTRRTAVVVLAAALLLAGCTSGGGGAGASTPAPSSSGSTTTPTVFASPTATTFPLPAGGIAPKVAAPSFRTSHHLGELRGVPYAVGRTLYVGDRTATLPRGVELDGLVVAGDGVLANGSHGTTCGTWFLGSSGPLLRLVGTCVADAVKSDGSAVAGRYALSRSDRPAFGIWSLPSARLTVLSQPQIDLGGPQADHFDGDDVILAGGSSTSDEQVRWDVSTGVFTPEPLQRPARLPWLDQLVDEEWSLSLSPDGSLGAIFSSSGTFIGVRRVSDGSYAIRERQHPDLQPTFQAHWRDDDTVLFVVSSTSGNNSRIATLHVADNRVTWSSWLAGELRIAVPPRTG